MKRLTATLCLTIAVLLGSVGVSASADIQKGLTSYDRGDYATALREWTPLAEQGDAFAQLLLGAMYANGDGVSQDYKIAVKWYRLSAEQGEDNAMFTLSLSYEDGKGVKQDLVYAHMWRSIAAMNGNLAASMQMDILEEKMTQGRVIIAQDLARECVRKKYKGC